MDDIEHLVRVTLTDRAAEVTAPRDLARAARGRAYRGRRRVQAVGVAVAAAAVLLALPAAARVWSTAPPSTVDAGAAPTTPAVPRFPYTPQVSPPGYGAPIAELSAGTPSLRYDGGPDRWLTVTVFAERPAAPRWDEAPKSTSVALRELKAGLEWGRSGYALTWQELDGRWMRVEADPHLRLDDLLRFAEGLRPGGVAVRWPFTFDAVPQGLVPDVVSPAAVSFRPAGDPPSHGFAGKLTVMLSVAGEEAATGRPVRVGGRAGWLVAKPAVSTLSVDLGDGRTLVIQAYAAAGLDEEALVAFAAGVHPTAHAVVGHG